MRRRVNGLLVPGILLTVLASVGVAALLLAGVPVLPDGIPSISLSGESHERRRASVDVTASASPRPRTPAPTTPPAPPKPPATGRPNAPVAGPTTTRPAAPPPSKTARPARPPATTPVKPAATTAPCKPGTVTLPAVADAYVDQSSPGKNYDGGNLFVASRDKGRNRRALVRFAMPAVPKGCTLRSAALTLAAKDTTGRRLLVARAGGAWSESRVTWSTAPKPTGAPAAARLNSARIAWDVTGHVLAGAARGFVVYDAAESSKTETTQANFGDRDSRTPPVLTIRWS